ncbi:hypothetical protein CLV92_11456 [Kineococcus xinjiangensis]|uniref:Phosphotransferase family enzyme n=1 Tax=Kineococcus xinjiangensis TaxID=512762 RepID=A0A2S6IE07_9ACTN|nr:hypothetical protein [Kineococcus xinjiangensis]PPK92455.1 hypothetical protein CLV92_11456 [Kineococcus xinjiangensis]
MQEQRLVGGNDEGAVAVGATVRRHTGAWTPAVHALLRHLEAKRLDGVPRVLGIDEQGREVLTFLPGDTIGTQRPWPAWAHADETLVQVGGWLRRYHEAVADFVPPEGACWRTSLRPWRPGEVIGHNDAGPYNAVWQPTPQTQSSEAGPQAPVGVFAGFVDWDFAGPCSRAWDLAFVAFSWVPLHARAVVTAEGFTDFADRPRRLRLFLDAYGWTGGVAEVLDAVQERVSDHARTLRALAACGDPLFARLVDAGVIDRLEQALTELHDDRATFTRP